MNIFNILTSPISNFFYLFLFQLSNCKFFYWIKIFYQINSYLLTYSLPTTGIKWIDSKEFDWDKYTRNSSERYVFQVDLEYPKELQELHNDYPLAPDKIEIKK